MKRLTRHPRAEREKLKEKEAIKEDTSSVDKKAKYKPNDERKKELQEQRKAELILQEKFNKNIEEKKKELKAKLKENAIDYDKVKEAMSRKRSDQPETKEGDSRTRHESMMSDDLYIDTGDEGQHSTDNDNDSPVRTVLRSERQKQRLENMDEKLREMKESREKRREKLKKFEEKKKTTEDISEKERCIAPNCRNKMTEGLFCSEDCISVYSAHAIELLNNGITNKSQVNCTKSTLI